MTLRELFVKVLRLEPESSVETLEKENAPSWDSARHIELIAAIEDVYKIRLRTREIYTLKSFSDAKRILSARGIAV